MSHVLPQKIGYFTITDNNGKFHVDSGKTINLKTINKTIVNKNRIEKDFKTYVGAVNFIKKQLKKKKPVTVKSNFIKNKSVYLVLLKEKESGRLFVKVGFTTKKYILGRFSKKFGYNDYELVSIIRRLYTQEAEKYEKKIKEELKGQKIKKFQFLSEGFSGYSECFDFYYQEKIIKVFDELTKPLLI